MTQILTGPTFLIIVLKCISLCMAKGVLCYLSFNLHMTHMILSLKNPFYRTVSKLSDDTLYFVLIPRCLNVIATSPSVTACSYGDFPSDNHHCAELLRDFQNHSDSCFVSLFSLLSLSTLHGRTPKQTRS